MRLTDEDRASLAEAIHHRNEFDYDQCDHGTYRGGPSHGEPYAMCERAAGEASIVVQAVEAIVEKKLTMKQTPEPATCWKKEPHLPHRPWVTSWGGGHWLGDDEPSESTKRREKNVRQVYCPGLKGNEQMGKNEVEVFGPKVERTPAVATWAAKSSTPLVVTRADGEHLCIRYGSDTLRIPAMLLPELGRMIAEAVVWADEGE